MKRLFVAIKVVPNSNLLNCFDYLKETLKGDKIKWVEEENLHLTINFIGETSETKLDDIVLKLGTACGSCTPFSLTLEGLGVFGAKNNPRVAYVNISEGGEFRELSRVVNLALIDLRVQDEIRPIKPHLTLGRIKSIVDIAKLNNLIDRYKDFTFQNFKVQEINLFESILTPKGPRYIALKKFEL